jgi:hypothetical protein
VAVVVPAVPETATVKLPAAIVAEVVKSMVAPPEGMLIGNVDVVVSPAGSVPRVIVGLAVVPDSLAVTVMAKEALGDTVNVAGVAVRDRVGVGGDVGEEPLPAPPPQPTKAIPANANKSPRQITTDGDELCRAYITVSNVSRLQPAYQAI